MKFIARLEISGGKCMMNFLKKNKKAIITVAIMGVAGIGGIILFEKYMSVNKINEELKTIVSSNDTIEEMAKRIKVSGHIRNLPNGYHASQGKIAEAAERGIKLCNNQTLVNSYNKIA